MKFLVVPILANQKTFLCGTYCRVLRDATQNLQDVFRGEKIHAQKASDHVVSTCACASCKGTISFTDSDFLEVAFDCLPTCVIFTASGTLLKCGTELLCCGSAGQRSVLLDSPAECGTVGKYVFPYPPPPPPLTFLDASFMIVLHTLTIIELLYMYT